MEKILLLPACSLLGDLAEQIRALCPGITVTANFEQVYAQVKLGEIERVCIILDTATETPLNATVKFHGVNKSLPVLVWDGVGEAVSSTENEFFLDSGEFSRETYFDITEIFFKGELSLKKVNTLKVNG